jgi:uncharacterized protein CbrC (UPF0167 family)
MGCAEKQSEQYEGKQLASDRVHEIICVFCVPDVAAEGSGNKHFPVSQENNNGNLYFVLKVSLCLRQCHSSGG